MPRRITFRNARAKAARRPADGFRDGGHAITPEAAERAWTRPCALLRDMVEYSHLRQAEVERRPKDKTQEINVFPHPRRSAPCAHVLHLPGCGFLHGGRTP